MFFFIPSFLSRGRIFVPKTSTYLPEHPPGGGLGDTPAPTRVPRVTSLPGGGLGDGDVSTMCPITGIRLLAAVFVPLTGVGRCVDVGDKNIED